MRNPGYDSNGFVTKLLWKCFPHEFFKSNFLLEKISTSDSNPENFQNWKILGRYPWFLCRQNFHKAVWVVPRICGKNFHNLPIRVNATTRTLGITGCKRQKCLAKSVSVLSGPESGRSATRFNPYWQHFGTITECHLRKQNLKIIFCQFRRHYGKNTLTENSRPFGDVNPFEDKNV